MLETEQLSKENLDIDSTDCYLLPDTIISDQEFFEKLPAYGTFIQNIDS